MIENSLIVNDTRKIRCDISEKFGDDIDRYIDYLLSRTAVTPEMQIKQENIIAFKKTPETISDQAMP
ncbi:MAG: hypothetical protein GY862_02960 [Gammaproteobacteria bacterium]|nr:hypothetical protein [Gammaproteobacteria bacterium]